MYTRSVTGRVQSYPDCQHVLVRWHVNAAWSSNANHRAQEWTRREKWFRHGAFKSFRCLVREGLPRVARRSPGTADDVVGSVRIGRRFHGRKRTEVARFHPTDGSTDCFSTAFRGMRRITKRLRVSKPCAIYYRIYPSFCLCYVEPRRSCCATECRPVHYDGSVNLCVRPLWWIGALVFERVCVGEIFMSSLWQRCSESVIIM